MEISTAVKFRISSAQSVLIVCLLGLVTSREEIYSKEVCHLETLEATCPDDHVIMVHEALYGRMAMSRCMKRFFGFEGCKADVLQELDKQCSGRPSCSFLVTKLHEKEYPEGCPDELTSYLYIRYSCKQVLGCTSDMCQNSDFLQVTTERGILSSHVMLTSGCGSASCPWVLQAQTGQRFNLTLIDLWPRANMLALDPNKYPRPICNRYATISESGYVSKDITSCGDEYLRESDIYQSETNTVKIVLYSSTSEDSEMQFLIKYEVIQCPDIDPPFNAKVMRSGDRITVACVHSKGEWHLVCQGTAWVGEIGTCNDTIASQRGGNGDNSRGSPFGMLIVIGLGVALGVLIGIMLLVVVFLFMKRHRRRELLRRQRTLLADSSPGRDEIGNKLHPHGRAVQMPGGVVRYIPDHSFTATIQLKRPLPLPLEERHDFPLLTSSERTEDFIMDSGCKYNGCTGVDTGRGHVYETTRGNVPIGTGPMPWKQIHRHSSDSIVKTPVDVTEPEMRSNITN